MPAFLRLLFLLVLAMLPIASYAEEKQPTVLVTIKPLHSLVSNLLEDIAQPELLIDGYQSPHTFTLRPSDAIKLEQADVVIWIGPTMETALRKLIDKRKTLTTIELSREGHLHSTRHNHHEDLHTDPHRWLNPVLAISDLKKIARAIAEQYPVHSLLLEQNYNRLKEKLTQLDNEIQAIFTNTKTISGLLYHDAWNYFLDRYGIETHGVINPGAHTQPGTRHLYELGQTIEKRHTRCLLIEPQFKPRYIDSLQDKYQLKTVVLDPLGSELPADSDSYFTIMRQITSAFAQCQ